MAWVTISLRKQALRARMDNLNFKLMQLSQQQQSMQMSGGYATSVMNAQKNQKLTEALERHQSRLGNITGTGSTASKQVSAEDARYQQEQMYINSLFQSLETGQSNLTKNKETAISNEIETLKTQLQHVSQEYDSLEKGLESDIKRDTIKLA